MAIANAIRDKEILENPQECRELVLDGQKIKNITIEDINFLEAFKNLETLSLNQTQLSTLHHLPPLKSLFSLELQDNKLSGAQCIHVICEKCPNLQSLLLAGNRFNDIQDFLPLVCSSVPSDNLIAPLSQQKLKDLEEIDVSMNPVVNDDEQIRASMFSMLPQLKVCNGRDREGNEVEFDDDEEGVEGSENIDEYEEDDDIDSKYFSDQWAENAFALTRVFSDLKSHQKNPSSNPTATLSLVNL